MFADILQVFSSIFSGEAAYRNLTALKDKVGEHVFGQNITLIDDPLHPDSHFKIPFDDEGVACQRREVIKDGVFQGFNHNLKTASIFKKEPTGNGFRGSISPTNLYLEPSKTSFDDMISVIEDGVYITDLVGLHAGVKTVSGDFSLQASGRKIVNGKLDHAVKMIVVSGNFFDMMNHVKGIASDLRFDLSGIGSPAVYVESLMIGGE
jgi:PmbA protein